MPSLPQTETRSLIDEINMLPRVDRHNRFVLNPFKQKANALREKHPDQCFLLLGVIATLENKIDDVRHYFNQALQFGPRKLTYLNYAVSLSKLARIEEAVEMAWKAYLADPTDLHIIATNMDICISSGRISRAAELANAWFRLCPDGTLRPATALENMPAVFQKYEIDEDALQNALTLVYKLLVERRIYTYSSQYAVSNDFLSFIYEVDINKEECIALEQDAENIISEHLKGGALLTFDPIDNDLYEFIDSVDALIQSNPSIMVKADEEQMKRIADLLRE
ncbi:MAG: hypothetical protein ABSG91_05620 [Syntrophobacteraceae bacterium]|jgi:tetratricopeptide (TPR) repeat protein